MAARALIGSSPWSYALRGLIALLFGAILLFFPGPGLAWFILVYAAFSLIDGVIATVAAFVGVRGRRIDWALLIGGLVSIAVGVIFFQRPLLSLGVLAMLIALWMIAIGVSTILTGFQERRHRKGEWLVILAGIFPVGFGIYLLFRPLLTIAALPLLLGGYALFWGVLLLGTAFSLWRRKDMPVASTA